MTEDPYCSTCVHFARVKLECPAFPKGIPDEILFGEDEHLKVRKDQVGDIVYAPIPE